MTALATSQREILQRLKTRGPQSVKILARQLAMSTMGVRQHLSELEQQQLVKTTAQTHQTRGRPVHLWQLTRAGHGHFADAHAAASIELIEAVRAQLGEDSLERLILHSSEEMLQRYRQAMTASAATLQERIEILARLRSEAGYMAEVRLLPDGWLLIENHCPIAAAASHCRHYCSAEQSLFEQLLGDEVDVLRCDHLSAGDRRCAYKISARASQTAA